MRAAKLALSSALLSVTCGPRYKTPCTFNAVITIDDRAGVEEACKDAVMDDGWPVPPGRFINGCASRDGRIHTLDRETTIAHEVRHLRDWYCK